MWMKENCRPMPLYWIVPKPKNGIVKNKHGVLQKYARLVASASEGAVTSA